MKKKGIAGKALTLLAIMALLITAVAVIAGANTVAPGSKGEIDVYLIAGQSNAVGFGSDELSYSHDNPQYTNGFEDVLFWGKYQSDYNPEKFVPVTTGLGRVQTAEGKSKTVGAEIGMAASLTGSGRMSAIIKRAYGSTFIYPDTTNNASKNQGTWTPPTYIKDNGIVTDGTMIGFLYNDLIATVAKGIEMLKADGYIPVFKGAWYMQGEAETSEKLHAEKYEELITDFINDLRRDITNLTGEDYSALPFVMGRITRNPTTGTRPYLDVVNSAQDKVAAKLSKVSVVETGGLTQLDSWHYSADAQHYIGTQFISKVRAMDGKFGISLEGANVSISGTGAKAPGETVTITVIPYKGCELNLAAKMRVGATETAITLDANGSYTFTMPESDVTIIASATDSNAITTAYGIIPSWYVDADKYPCIVFKDGEFVSPSPTWHEAVKVATVAAKGTKSGGNNVQILFRRSVEAENLSSDIAFIGGTLTVDLDGYALIARDKQLFNMIGKSTDGVVHDTSVVIKNGYLLSKKPIMAFNNSAEEAYTTRKNFYVDFTGVTFGFYSYTSQMLLTSYNDGTVGLNAYVTFTDCSFNFDSFKVNDDITTVALTANTTVFNLSESSNKNNIHVTLKGGTVNYGACEKYVTLYTLDAANQWGSDSVVFAKDSSGNYTTFTSSKDFTKSHIFKTEDGKTIECIKSGSGYVYAEIPADRITEYGYIPSNDTLTNPFVLFQDGAYVKSYGTWYKFLADAGTINWSKETTLLLRSDYTTTTCGAGSSNLYLVGDLTIDLNGKTFTRGDYHMFQAMRKSDVSKQTNITVKNGVICSEKKNASPVCFNSDGTLATDASAKISFNFTFNGVSFTADTDIFTSGYMICDAYGDGTVGTENTIVLNDCTINVPSTKVSTLFNTNDTDKDNEAEYNKHKIAIEINGGTLTGTLNPSFKFVVLGNGDSFKFGKGKDGKMLSAKLKAITDYSTYPTTGTVSEGKTYYLVEYANDGTYSYFNLGANETAYGNINPANLSALKYPFILFNSDKTPVKAYSTWKDAIAAGPSGILVMRRDYSTGECGGSSSNVYLCKDLTIDLGGFTLSQPASGGSVIFNARRLDNTTFNASITVKNGTISVAKDWNPVIVVRNNDTATDTAADRSNFKFNFTFNSVKFTSSDTYKGRLVLEAQQINDFGGTVSSFIFNDCEFNYASSVNSSPIFRLREDDKTAVEVSEKHDISIVINGGKITACKAVTLATFSNANATTGVSADSLKFGPYNGSYIKYVLPTGTAQPAIGNHVLVNGNTDISFANLSDSSNAIYLLGEDGYLDGYGKIPFSYMDAEKYPFVAFKDGVCSAGLTNWANNNDAAGSITSAMYYAMRNKDATIVMRRNYTATTDSHNNFSHIVNVTVDLGGFTFTTGNNAMIQAMAKTNGSSGVIDTTISVKNGTILVTKYAVVVFNHANFDTYTTAENWFVNFDNVTFGFADGATANGLVTSTMEFSSTGNVGSTPIVTLTDCVINAKAGVPIFNLNDSKDLVNASVFVYGGVINASSLGNDDIINGSGNDSVSFKKEADSKYTSFAISGTDTPTAIINGGELLFLKKTEDMGTVTYVLVSASIISYAPKTGITVYTDFNYNVYLPKNTALTDVTFNGEVLDVTAFEVVNLEGEDFYKLPAVSLKSFEALADISLTLTLTVDGEKYNASFSLGFYEYAESVIGGNGTEAEIALVKDMLSYVKASYAYWSKTSDKLSDIDTLLGQDYASTADMTLAGSAEAPVGTGFTGVTLHLGDAPSYRFYYKDTAPAYTFTVGNRAVNAVSGTDESGKTYLEVKVSAYEMLSGISFGEYTYSVYAYYAWASEKDMSAEMALVERLVNYCEAAEAYRLSTSD